MSWYLFIRDSNGDLVSSGSEVPAHLTTCMEGSADPSCTYVVRDVGESPDWSTHTWDEGTRTLVERLPPVLIDRLDDIQTRLMADPDFAARWQALNPTQRTQLRTGIMRVLAALIGGRRFRDENEAIELD